MSAQPIVAATDGSEESLRAAEWAAREAAVRGAPLRIVSAAVLLPRMIGGHAMSGYDTVADTIREHRDQALAAAAERAAKAAPGLLIDTDHLDGPPAEAVTASGSGALMLVVGSRGVGGFAAMVLGSVSRYAATHASCPVVVVREAAESARRQVGIGIGDLENTASLTFAFEEAALRKASLIAVHSWHLPESDISRAGPTFPEPAATSRDRNGQAPRAATGRLAGQVPRRPGQPGPRPRPPGPGAGRPVGPRRPGGARQADRAPRARLGHARRAQPRARPRRHRPFLNMLADGGARRIPAEPGLR